MLMTVLSEHFHLTEDDAGYARQNLLRHVLAMPILGETIVDDQGRCPAARDDERLRAEREGEEIGKRA